MKKPLPDFKVRLPQSLKDEIEASARRNNRSMNSEIVSILEAFFAAGGVTHASGFDMPAAADDARMAALEQRLSYVEIVVGRLEEKDRTYDHEVRIGALESRR